MYVVGSVLLILQREEGTKKKKKSFLDSTIVRKNNQIHCNLIN